MRLIRNQAELSAALEALSKLDPVLGEVAQRLAPIPLRLREPGFASLCEIVIGQQVSKASAAAMTERLKEACSEVTPARFQKIGAEGWIAIGLSRAKQKTISGLASSILSGNLDLVDLETLAPSEAMERLTALQGIGPWTAQVYCMFCIGHGDVFPTGDIALQTAIFENFAHDCRRNPGRTAHFSLRWQPVRGAAARVLWADYADRRKRKELPV